MSNESAKAETSAATTTTTATATTSTPLIPKSIIDALEEDDEFEEFENEQWSKSDTTAAAQIPTQQQQWMDNWDDDMDDDFTKSLRAALTKD